MTVQYFSGQVSGLRGPGLTAAQQADVDAARNGLNAEAEARIGAVSAVLGDDPNTFILSNLKRLSLALGDDPNFRLNVLAAIGTVGDSAYLLGRDAANQARANSIMETPHNLSVVALNAARCLLLGYGQSLINGQEAHPAVTGTPTPNTFMIGQSVRPATFDQPAWTPIGAAALNPLIATVEAQLNTGRAPLTAGQIAALPVHDSAEGESPIVAVVRQVARAWYSYGDKPARKFVAAACGVSGRLIENLLKGASPNLYQRVIDAVTVHKTLGDAAGESVNVGAVLWMQGEWNYIYGPSDKADHKAKLATLRNSLNTDIAAITGQSFPPVFLTYVTSGQFMDDPDHASISMAQVEFALETPGVICVGPTYPVTDKGGHLTADGSRWFGAMAAKIATRVLVDRLAWEPLYPLAIEQVGSVIYIHHHVPAGPLRFSPAYDETSSELYADFGFQVSDNAGNVPISSVSIIGATIVKIICSRTPGAGATVVYADKTVHDGNGNLCDSDPAQSEDNSIASGQPYPLANWCPPYSLPVGYTRS